MKKIGLLFLVVFVPLWGDYISPAPQPEIAPGDCAHEFRGFDFKIGLGYGGMSGRVHIFNKDKEDVWDIGGGGVAVQAKLRGTISFKNLFIASFSIYGQYNSDQADHYEYVDSYLDETRRIYLTWNVGFDVRFGYVPSYKNLIFVYLGPDWGLERLSYNYTGGKQKFSKFALGPRFGVGGEHKMGDHILALVSFDYAYYPTRSYFAENGVSTTIRAQLATFLVALGYLF